MRFPALAPDRGLPLDRCGHCDRLAARVWLVPGDVLDSCRDCFVASTGREPVHAQGHSTRGEPRDGAARPRPSAGAFYPGARERRSA